MAKTLIVFASKQEFQFFFKNISSVVASSTPAMVNPSVDTDGGIYSESVPLKGQYYRQTAGYPII